MDKGPVVNPFGRAPFGPSSLLTYEPYYGLKEKAFSLSSEPKFLYKSPSHAAAFEDLLLGIKRREGLIVLTGDIGTGKTTLCRAVLEQLDRKTFSTFVPDPFVSREDLLKMILIDFGVMSVEDLKSGRLAGASRADLSYLLYDFLNSLVPLQAFAVLVIDEAQNLSLPLLEEIRILSDLEAPEKLLQVVLIGQLEFQARLKLPEMRQLDQRVSVRCQLEALNRQAVGGYISHRLTIAGATEDRVHFSPNAIDAIARTSGGVPRVVNLIADRALHRGHLERKSVIDLETVTEAVTDLGIAELTAFQAAPAAAPATTPPAAPAPPAVEDDIDLSALEVGDVDAAVVAAVKVAPKAEIPLMFQGALERSRPTTLGESVGTRRWRRRAMKAVWIAALLAAIVFFVLFGQAVFVTLSQ